MNSAARWTAFWSRARAWLSRQAANGWRPPLAFRYVGRQLVLPFFLAVGSLYAMRVMLHVADNMEMVLGPQTTPLLLFKYYTLQFAEFGQQIAPAALLAAMLWVTSRASKNGEWVAWQAGGLSPGQVTQPLLVFSLAVCVLLQVMGMSLTPWARSQWLALEGYLRGRPMSGARYENFSTISADGRSVWYVPQLEMSRARAVQPEVLLRGQDGADQYKIFARHAQYDPQRQRWEFFNARRLVYRAGAVAREESFQRVLVPELADPPEQLARWLQDPQRLDWPTLCRLVRHPGVGAPQKVLARFRTELYYRLAAPLVCPVLYLVAVLLTARDASRRGGAWLAVLQSFGVMLALQTWIELSRAMGNYGVLPAPVAAWNAIVLFGGAAAFWALPALGWACWQPGRLWEKARRRLLQLFPA